jgi:hypothetical protein
MGEVYCKAVEPWKSARLSVCVYHERFFAGEVYERKDMSFGAMDATT